MGRSWTLALLLFPPVPGELYYGNIHLLLAAAIVLGFEHPWTWAFVLLTKVTPGIGLLWFAVRREWRNLAIALAATGLVVLISLPLGPDLWGQWSESLLRSSTSEASGVNHVPVSLLIRLPIAVVIVIWGARRDAPWTVPVACTLALPTIWTHGFSVLVGALVLARGRTTRRAEGQPSSLTLG